MAAVIAGVVISSTAELEMKAPLPIVMALI
jgi:hypothetical protein